MNVVLVTVDCLRRDRCGIYGHHRDTTPTLDAVARDGFVYDRAMSTGPVTTESFPGILAGRLSAQTVTRDTIYQKCIPEGEPTLASHLQDQGYSTTAVISNPRIGPHVASDRGFEIFRNLRNSEDDDSQPESDGLLPDMKVGSRLYNIRERMRTFDSPPLRYEVPFLGFRTYQYLSGWPSVRGESVVDEFLEALSGTDSPFFGWTHLMDVHGPIHPAAARRGDDVDGLLRQFRSQARRVSDTPDARTEYRYDGAVRYVDEQLGRIVDWLQDRGLWDETALIVTSDHGDALMDRGIYGHPQHYTYEELLSVPLVVRVPGEDGERIERPFSLGWLHELVCESCDVSHMDAPLSSSVDPLSDAGEGETVLADSISHRGHSVVARQGDTKYVTQTDELEEPDEVEVGTPGVYRLDRDPMERTTVEEAVPELEAAAEEVALDDPESLRSRAESSGIDAATRDQLKQLGYAE